MAKRSAQGAGTIRQRPDGRWEARYTLGRDPGTGKQVQKSVYGKTQKEVLKKLQAVSVDIENGTYTAPTKMTVGEWLDIWLAEYTSNLKPLSRSSYASICKTHFKPHIGAIKLTDLSAHHIQKLYNSLYQEKGLASKSLVTIHGVLHKALQQAYCLRYIRNNPSDFCTLPKVTKKEIQPLTEEQIKDFLHAIENERYKDLYTVTLFTGMRQSEVLGLSWGNVDFKNGVIHIKEQLLREHKKGGRYYRSTLKNDRTRNIMPAPSVMRILHDLKRKQNIQRLKAGSSWGMGDPVNDGLVFTNEIGGHLTHVTVYNRYKRIVSELGIEYSRFHDLRHTYAVTSLQNGDDVKTVQESLGHHTAAFTLDVYGHVTERMRQESANRMEKFIKNL